MAGSGGRGLQERGGGPQIARYNLQSHDRKITNVLRVGIVIDCDYANGKVRVQIGEAPNRRAVTRWVNWMCRKAGYDRAGDETPELYEQVLIYCPSGRFEQARVLMRLRQNLHPLPSTDPNDSVYLYRILEGTNHWTALERKRLVGDVNPVEKRTNYAEELHTTPPGEKVLNSDAEYAYAAEYYWQTYIRPELLAVMEYVAMVTQPNAAAFLKLVANAMDSGTAEALFEAAIRGDGDSLAHFRSVSGDSTFDTDTNPNAPYDRQRTTGNAHTIRETLMVDGSGDATETVETSTVGGNATGTETVRATDHAQKTIVIDGGTSELLIQVRNSAHLRIEIGESGQYIDADGTDIIVDTPGDATVNAGGDINLTAGGAINMEASSVNIDASSVSISSGSASWSTGSLSITQGGGFASLGFDQDVEGGGEYA